MSAACQRRSSVDRGSLDGKLGAMHVSVTMEREVSLPHAPAASDREQSASETAALALLRRRIAASLHGQAEEIASRWVTRLEATVAGPPAPMERVPRAERCDQAAALIRSFASALTSDDADPEDVVTLGHAVGTAARNAGTPLHHLLHALDLLEALCLCAMEEAVAPERQADGLGDGIRLCRRMQRVAACSITAAARGYTQAANDATREHFRRLRHDLRNPLGTIQGVLSLMEDDSVPEETRRGPRFRSMIQRSVRALDQLIVARLGDAEATAPSTGLDDGKPRHDVGGAGERDHGQSRAL
jgi:signal transduction histidine kinase